MDVDINKPRITEHISRPRSVLVRLCIIREWIATSVAIFALISLLSPKVASTSITPWAAFLLMNIIFMYDGVKRKNWGWVALCLFGACWDVLLIVSRSTGLDVFWIFQPLVVLLEQLP